MASPTSAETALLDELEEHAGSVEELVMAYEFGLRNAGRNRNLVVFLAGRLEYHAQRLQEIRCRRDALRQELQKHYEAHSAYTRPARDC